MMNKKGDQRIAQDIFIGVVAGLIFVVIFFIAFKGFAAIIPGTGDKAQCSNRVWWDNDRGVKDTFQELDSGTPHASSFFYNSNCNLVFYGISQGVPEISYPGVQPAKPAICLCNIERDLISREAHCAPYDCYKFNNFDDIRTNMFSTEDLDKYMVINFRKNGRILEIESVGDERPTEPLIYTKQAPTQLDPTGLIHKLEILFSTREIRSFIPIVKIKEAGFIIPQEIPNIEGFTILFDIDLALPPSKDQQIAVYLSNPNIINPHLVRVAYIEISIPKSKIERLTESQRNSIGLYYKKENTWVSVQLQCIEREIEFLCNTQLREFSNNFAISISTFREAYTSDSVLERELSQFIQEVATGKGIDPLFIKAIIKTESQWQPDAVSTCGAAGLMQIMPHTGRGLGLSVIDPVNNVDFNEEQGNSCAANAPYGTALKQFVRATPKEQLILVDDRFNEKKAITAAVNYFGSIRDILSRRGIPATLENIATAYNRGPYSKNIGPSEYSRKVMEEYNKLISSATSLSSELYTSESELTATQFEQITIATSGPCSGLREGVIPIPQDDKVRCLKQKCCSMPESVAQIEKIRQTITRSDQRIIIGDAARPPTSQRNAFLAYLAGRVEACAPLGIDDKEELAARVPNGRGTTAEERAAFARTWLEQNDPTILTIIDDLTRYGKCRHVTGRALDVQLARGTSTGDIRELRNIMCSAGWANYGKEWWHYEYLSPGYYEARNSNQCYFSEDTLAAASATVTPNYA